MKRRKREITLMVFAAFIVAFFLGRAIFSRMTAYMSKLDADIDHQKTLLATANMEIKKNAEFVKKWNEIKSFMQEPVEERKNIFTAYLQSLEAQRDFDFDDLSLSEGAVMQDHEEFQTLSYKLTFSADLDDLVEFLDRLDLSEKLLRVERLEIFIKRKISSYATRYETSLPSTKNLFVTVTVSIPAGHSWDEIEPEEEML